MPRYRYIVLTLLVIIAYMIPGYIFQFDITTGYTGNIALILLGHTDKTLFFERIFPVVEIGAGIYINDTEIKSISLKPYFLGGIDFEVYKSENILILIEGVVAYSLTGFTLGLGTEIHF